MKHTIFAGSYLHEWSRGRPPTLVKTQAQGAALHGHFLTPMGFWVCGIGHWACEMNFPKWKEGQVADDS